MNSPMRAMVVGDPDLHGHRDVPHVGLDRRPLDVGGRGGERDAVRDRVRDEELPEAAGLLLESEAREVGRREPVHAAADADRDRKLLRRPQERDLRRELVVGEIAAAVDLHGDVVQRHVLDAEADLRRPVETPQRAAARVDHRGVEAMRDDDLGDTLVVRQGRVGVDEAVPDVRGDALDAFLGRRRRSQEERDRGGHGGRRPDSTMRHGGALLAVTWVPRRGRWRRCPGSRDRVARGSRGRAGSRPPA